MGPYGKGDIRLEESKLVARMRKGDPEAWRWLCETYGKPLFLFAYYRNGDNASGAEDIRQETLLAALQAIGNYRGEVPLFGWLCGIARHKLSDEAERLRKQKVSLNGIGDDAEQHGLVLVGTSLGNESLPEEVVEDTETRAAVVQALWSLPEKYREVIIYRYYREKSVGDIAKRFGCSYKATESLLARAKKAFRRSLVEEEKYEKR